MQNSLKDEPLFSQRFISFVSGQSPASVSRFISQSEFASFAHSVGIKKKYSFENTRKILRNLCFVNHIAKDKIQVFFNFKGGTGKTSLCHQVSVHTALFGYKVLVIDCDPQSHLSYVLGINEHDNYKTLYDIIMNNVPIEEAIIKNVYSGLDLIPANLSLTRLELPLNQKANREKVLWKLLSQIRDDYDFIFIDTNPTISTLNRNATLAADVVNIVCETQPFSLKGLEMLIEEMNIFSEAMEEEIRYKIIPNKYESKTATSQEALGKLRQDYGDHVMPTIVRRCEDINISAKLRKPVFNFCSKNSMALEDITDLTKEILETSTVVVK